MRCFWDEQQALHAPAGEFFNGSMHAPAESPARVGALLEAIGATEAPLDEGLDPIVAVHDKTYVAFLQAAHADWIAAGREGDAFPYTFPLVGRRSRTWNRIDATIGNYSFDTSTPIGAHTWSSAYWSAQTAISAVDAVSTNQRTAFALCRPPGHHAGPDYCGGYSYLNNAAIGATRALSAGKKRAAILDVDYHHGNGTEDIFARRDDVLFASIHADPLTDYPFYWGHADENCANLFNQPLPRGTAWNSYEPALMKAIDWIANGAPDILIVSFGADTHEADPISQFRLKTGDYASMGKRIASLGLPTAIIMEGGYSLDAIGPSVAELLSGF